MWSKRVPRMVVGAFIGQLCPTLTHYAWDKNVLDLEVNKGHKCPMTHRERLLSEIQRYCEMTSTSERAFSLAATGNPKFISRLRAGNVTLRLFQAAEDYLHQQRAIFSGEIAA